MTIKESTWVERGRLLYEFTGGLSLPTSLSIEDARGAVAKGLRTSIHRLSEQEREAAMNAAARGYLDACRAQGRPVNAAPATQASRPRRTVVSPNTITFLVTQGHPLVKGLTGGRVRVPPGETAIGAAARRIARDTYCEVVAVHEDEPPEAEGEGSRRYYRVTVRGRDGARGAGGGMIEGTVRLMI